jgi:hypothetical protein
MEDEDLMAIVRSLLLAINGLQESVSAVVKALKERGLMTREEYAREFRFVHEANRSKGEMIQKLGMKDPILEFLRGFEGPIQ